MTTYVNVDFDYARFKAEYLVKSHNISKAPINVFDTIRCFKNCNVEVRNLGKVEACTGYCQETNEYIIYLNDKFTNNRARFSFAHELGHIYLEHFTKYDINSLSDKQKDLLDLEADAFASEFLMPTFLLEKCDDLSIENLSKLFKVSSRAVEIRLKFYINPAKRTLLEYVNRTNTYNDVCNTINQNAVTFVYGLSGNGKTELVSQYYDTIFSPYSKNWYSSKLVPNSIRIEKILNAILRDSGIKKYEYWKIQSKINRINELSNFKHLLVLDDLERSLEKDLVLDWIFKLNKNTNIKIVLITHTITHESLSNIYDFANIPVNSYRIVGMRKKETEKLVNNLIEKTENLKLIIKGRHDVLINKIHLKTQGNPYAIKLSIPYIESRISDISLEELLETDCVVGSSMKILNETWQHLLDDNTKKVISVIGLLNSKADVKKIADITQLSGFLLNKALNTALITNMIEIQFPDNSPALYTGHGLLYKFVNELMSFERCSIVKSISDELIIFHRRHQSYTL